VAAPQTLAGLKGYVNNIPIETMPGERAVAAYHDLYQVERSFRIARSDLAARPVFHRLRYSIEADLTIVFTALAVARGVQNRKGLPISRIIKMLGSLRTATIALGRQRITVPPRVSDNALRVIDDLATSGQ
jgi:hypothetical protein